MHVPGPGRESDWHSIREDAPEPPPAGRPAPRPSVRPGDLSVLRRRRVGLYLATGSMAGVGLALLVILVSGRRPAPADRPTGRPSRPVSSAPLPERSPAPPAELRPDRLAELDRLEAEDPRAFRSLYQASARLALDAPAGLEGRLRERMDRLRASADDAYRRQYEPVARRVREALEAHRPRQAQETLSSWTVPPELDVSGALAAELSEERALVEDLVAFEDLRSHLISNYQRGTFAPEAATALGPFLGSRRARVRSEAELALGELRTIRSLAVLGEKLRGRRESARARVEAARQAIAADQARDEERMGAWQARLVESTRKRPVRPQELGVTGLDVPLGVQKFDGRLVRLVGPGLELSLSTEELPLELFSRLVLEAPDPAQGLDLFEAGKLAVRRGAMAAARTLFDRAVRLDPALSERVPDLERLGGGLGTLRGRSELRGETLAIRYDFRTPEQAADFKTSPNCASIPGPGALTLEGERLFWGAPGELKFVGRIRMTAEPQSVQGSAGYVLGVSSELTPGDPDLCLVLIQPDRGYRVLRLHSRGRQDLLAEGGFRGRPGAVELSFERGRAEFRVGGVTLWTGHFPELAVFQPVVGGNGFQEGRVRVGYRSLRFEGRASPELIRRLESERLTVLEAELSRDRRATPRERREAEPAPRRGFGEGLGTPLPIEAELRDVIPGALAAELATLRSSLKELERTRTEEAILGLEEQIRRTLDGAVGEAPWFPLTYYYRAEWRYRQGDAAGALRDLEQAAELQESFVEAREARAELLLEAGRYPQAEEELAACLGAVPDLARARLSRALLDYYAGRDAEAILEVELVRRLEPEDLSLVRAARRLRNIVAGPRWSGSVSVETPNYVVRAESPRLERGGKGIASDKAVRERTEKYAQVLDAARSYFSQIVAGPETRARKPLVLICDTPESYYVYAEFASDDRLEHTAGVYFSPYEQLLFYRAETEPETLQTMTHEAFHEYLHAIVPSVPIWLDEGMAEYVSGITIEGGRVTASGGILKERLRNLQVALDRGWAGFPFEFVLGEPKAQFYTISPALQYAQAWSMVHFLMHGRGGKLKPLLDGYLERLVQTRSIDEARAVFRGQDLVALQREWRAYVRGLKP